MSLSSNPQPPSPASPKPPAPWYAQSRFRLIAALIAIVIIAAVAYYLYQTQQSNVPLGPQQTVQTINPKMGIHTRLTDEVEPWKIKKTLEMVREMGAPW